MSFDYFIHNLKGNVNTLLTPNLFFFQFVEGVTICPYLAVFIFSLGLETLKCNSNFKR